MTYRLERRQILRASIEEVFPFFTDPRNLETITPPWLGFRILEATDALVRRGTRIRYRLKLSGIPIRWESRISEYEEGVAFADEMVMGPYRSWYHRHLFRPAATGVEMTDIVDYALPFGPLGRVVHAVTVRRQLDAIFGYRARRIGERFGADPEPTASEVE